MANYGTAPRKVNGVWQTSSGRKLSPGGQRYWDQQVRMNRFDETGHRKRVAEVTTSKGTLRKPSFGTFLKASHGDKAAQKEVNSYIAKHEARQQTKAEDETRLNKRAFGPALPAVEKASKVVNPVAGEVIKSLSPTSALKAAAHAAKEGNIPEAGLAASGIFPLFPGKVARAAKAGFDAAEAAKAAKPAAAAVDDVIEAEDALRAFRGAKTQREAQDIAVSEARGKRIVEAEEARRQAGGGIAGHEAALNALRGEYPSFAFDALKGLNRESLDRLYRIVDDHVGLSDWDKLALRNAFKRAKSGRTPRFFEIALVEKAFGSKTASELVTSLPFSKKLMREAAELINIPRSILASFDVSAPFRQGLVAGAAHPVIFAKNLGPMYKMLVSEKRYGQVMNEILDRQTFEEMQKAGVKFTGQGGLGAREEAFMSNIAEKGKLNPVKASSRAYTGFLNRLRADVYDHLSDAAKAQGFNPTEDPHVFESIAKFVNTSTGRGDLGALEGAAVALNTVFFSPRLMASRFQALNPMYYKSLHPLARKQALGALAKLVAAGSTVAGLLALAGAKVGTNPTSADFGKVRLGNTRFDIWGGHQQFVTLYSRLASNRYTSSTTGLTKKLGGGFNGVNQLDLIYRFLEGKFSPPAGLVRDIAKHETFMGDPVTVQSEAKNLFVPLLMGDAAKLYQQTHSPWKTIGGYVVGAHGVGMQTYPDREPTTPRGGSRVSRRGSSSGSSRVSRRNP